ncbi:SapC family protein [Dechloromonas sp. ZY10]|uniref:SapC family protein n=1 Tax=Dechloromonas aquae TaxID=2664436 RepID=UPI0035283001
MNTQTFYRHLTFLDPVRHAALRLAPVNDFSFAAQSQTLPLLAVEMNEAQREFPLVFARDQEGQITPLALLGLRQNENLFIAADGRWQAEHLPAFIRRYPFATVQVNGEDLAVCVDEAAGCLSSAVGEPLFPADGSRELLTRIQQVLQEYQHEIARTRAFCTRLQELDLLREASAQIELPDGEAFSLTGMLIVEEELLRALSPEQVHALVQTGELALIQAHMLSLGNFPRLLRRRNQHPGA